MLNPMYGTSRLIIPPKPARNSPYIPKLRIRLRPSNGRNRLDRGNDRTDTLLATRTPRFSGRSTTGYMNGCSTDPPNTSYSEHNAKDIPKHLKATENESNSGRRTTRKRKSVSSPENVDLNDPDSVLTTISLKALINQDIFYSLPVDTQRMLATLLPLYDHEVQTWLNCFETSCTATPGSGESHYVGTEAVDDKEHDPTDASKSIDSSLSDVNNTTSKAVWLHPSSLNNEFFTKALQDYASSQARGDFAASRVRHRPGLRPSVRGQTRYTSPSLRSTQGQSHVLAEESNDDQGLTCTQSPKQLRQRSSGFRSNAPKSSVYANCSVKDNRAPSKDSLSGSPSLSSGSLTRLHRRINNRICRPLRRTKQLNTVVAVSTTTNKIRVTESSTASSSSTTAKAPATTSFPPAASHRHGEQDSSPVHVTEESPDTSSNLSNSLLNPNDWQKVSQCESPESECDKQKQSSRRKRPSDSPVIEGAVDYPKNCSFASSTTVTSTVTTPTVHSSLLNSSQSPTSTRHSQQQGSVLTNEITDIVPPQMPPPRQTKTLASMREKLRAKRLLKETERGQTPNGRQHYFHALPGSMTPHPASGGNGYFNAPTGYLSLTTSPLKFSSSGILASPTHGAATSLSLLFNGTSDDVACSGRVSRSSVYSGGCNSGHSSPRSLPAIGTSTCPVSTEVQSLVPSTVVGQSGSHFDAFESQTFLPFYPSSPHSTGSYSGHASANVPVTSVGSFSSPVSSPQPIRNPHPLSTATGYGSCGLLPRQEHSVSAPPTPLSPQAGHTLLVSAAGDKPCVPLVGQTSSPVGKKQSTIIPALQNVLSLRTLPMPGSSLVTQSDTLQPTPLTSVCSYGSLYGNSVSSDVNLTTSVSSQPTSSFPVRNPALRMSQSNPQLSNPSPSSTTSGFSTLISPTVNTLPIQKIDKIHSLAELSSSTDSSPTTSLRSEAMSKLFTNAVTTTTTSIAGSSPSDSNGSSSTNTSSTTQAKPNATTRAYFVDGENLPEAVAIIQNLNPGATITQQQFLLIPSPNKSQLFLCRAPVTKPSESLPTSLLNHVSPITTKTNMTAATDTAAKVVAVAASPRSPAANPIVDETMSADSNSLANSKTVPHATVVVDRSSKLPAGAHARASQGGKRTANQTRVSAATSKSTASLSIQPNHSVFSSQFPRLKPSPKGVVDQQAVMTSGNAHITSLPTTAVKQQIRQSSFPPVTFSGYTPTTGGKSLLMNETAASCHSVVGASQLPSITVSLLAATQNPATPLLQDVNSSVHFSQSNLSIGNQKNIAYSSVMSPCQQSTSTILTGSIASDFLIPSQNQVNTVISSPALLCSINPPMTCQYQTLPYSQNLPQSSDMFAACQGVASTTTPPITSYLFDGSLNNNVNPLEHHPPFQILHPSVNNTAVLFNGGSPKTGVHLAATPTPAAVAITPSLYCSVNNTTTGNIIMAPHSLQSAQAMIANNNSSAVCSPRLVVTPSSLSSNYLHHHHQQQ